MNKSHMKPLPRSSALDGMHSAQTLPRLRGSFFLLLLRRAHFTGVLPAASRVRRGGPCSTPQEWICAISVGVSAEDNLLLGRPPLESLEGAASCQLAVRKLSAEFDEARGPRP